MSNELQTATAPITPTVGEWIDFEKQKPPNISEDYLVYDSLGYYEVANWSPADSSDSEVDSWRNQRMDIIPNVTHWTPLPETPK